MINLAVIELKDIVKYLVKITITIVIVIALTKFFSGFKNKLNIDKNAFLSCLDIEIPSIKLANKQENMQTNMQPQKPLKMALDMELGILGSVEKNEEVENTKEEKKEESKDAEEELKEAQTGLNTEVLESNVPEKYTSEYNGVKIRNETDIKLTKEMLTPNVDVNTENIVIYHTHTCESYTPTENYKYKASGNFRTLDINYSVARVGTELTKYMQHYGYNVIHDTTLYDYPSYSESYDRSLKAVAKILQENEETDVLFDIHRDAIGDSTYAPTVKIGDEEAAQLMFVIGSDGGGSEHDNWNENLKLAIKIQEKANELYPGLFKPIILRNSRYNQQLAKGASIIEVGATGNTMEQCLTSMKYLSKVLSEVLK
jgi:stage II sporulation protein P